MNDLSLVSRLRITPSPGPAAETQRPFRFWMSGSLAVVMAALVPMRDLPEGERSSSMRVLRHSPFGVNETVLRIEQSARRHGLSVLARIDGSRPVIVLASSVGGTLVVMDGATSALDVPLSVMVRAGEQGGSDVLIASSNASLGSDGWSEMPAAVADDLAALPGLVDRALS